MSKKRGLSLEEKRTRMLEIFYEKKDFFLLKELEKIAPKEKGKVSRRFRCHKDGHLAFFYYRDNFSVC